MRTLLWYRIHDLRVTDHAPLREAAAAGEVIPLFVVDPDRFAPRTAQRFAHSTQFLLESLCSLNLSLAERGSRLVVVEGKSATVIPRLARQWKVDRVAAHRAVEPAAREREASVKRRLGARLNLRDGETLAPPGTLRTQAGKPFSVFTPFARALLGSVRVDRPLPAPRRLSPVPRLAPGARAALPSLGSLGIQHNPRLLEGGERAARVRLQRFLEGPGRRYHRDRDRMGMEGTSRLSADLRFGTLSIRKVWTEAAKTLGGTAAGDAFLNELAWREFCYSTLWDRPSLLSEPFRTEFTAFPWRFDEERWTAWALGRTGYPVVDAAARQLQSEGFVHNRARMISASFLTKHLLIGYQHGETYYLERLVDGHPAQNNSGWQWSAGCGCDAQPYFRVFNPVGQGEKFDPEGAYVRAWVPELSRLPAKWIHRPWQAPPSVLDEAGVALGRSYPRPIEELAVGRRRFLVLASKYLKKR